LKKESREAIVTALPSCFTSVCLELKIWLPWKHDVTALVLYNSRLKKSPPIDFPIPSLLAGVLPPLQNITLNDSLVGPESTITKSARLAGSIQSFIAYAMVMNLAWNLTEMGYALKSG